MSFLVSLDGPVTILAEAEAMLCDFPDWAMKGRAAGHRMGSQTTLRPPCCEGAQVTRGGQVQVLLLTDLSFKSPQPRGE